MCACVCVCVRQGSETNDGAMCKRLHSLCFGGCENAFKRLSFGVRKLTKFLFLDQTSVWVDPELYLSDRQWDNLKDFDYVSVE